MKRTPPARSRSHWFSLLCLGCLAFGAPLSGADAPAAAPKPVKPPDFATRRSNEVEPTRKVVYKIVGDRKLELHIFEPKGHQASDRQACLLMIHGGGWTAGNPRQGTYVVPAYFAERGWVGMSLDYRLHKPKEGTTVFDAVKDTRSAVRYVRSHAAELGIDPNRIVVAGRSAGGHLAATTAMCDSFDEPGEDTTVSCRPDALALYSGVLDTSYPGPNHEPLGDRWKDLSPLHQVRPGLPPTIVFHGMKDPLVPFEGAKAFADAMTRAGNRCEFVSHPIGAHSYVMRTAELFNDAMERTTVFLAQNGITVPVPTP